MSDPFTSSRPMTRPVAAPQPVAAPAHVAAPVVAEPPPVARAEPARAAALPMPQDFIYDAEHPVLPIPFKAQIGDHKLEGVELSVTAAYVAIGGALDPAWKGHKEVVKLQFDFQGFTVTLFPEIVVTGSRHDGEMTLQFMDPAGAHLPQLRYIINSYIAGDYVSMGGMLAYSGPTQPKTPKGAEATAKKFRLRSFAVAVMSLTLILVVANVLLARLTQSYEPRPVFIERTGKDMKATTAGQVAYLNPAAKKGEVVFSITANTGDELNFQLPCDCEVKVTEGIFEGATVLPIDSILSFFEPTVGVKVQTQMSIEGLSKVMSGERAYLDVTDGRHIPVAVTITSATNAASMRGDLFVPVTLTPAEGVLTADDIGKTARLRLSKPWFDVSFLTSSEKP